MLPLFALVVIAVPLVVLLVRPVERRLALRYPRRRPVEAALVVLGSLLGTAIITGSLVVGDTIDRSIRASAYDHLGPIDELVGVTGPDAGDEIERLFEGFESPHVDGVLRLDSAPAAVIGRQAQPRAQILELDFAEAQRFGGDPRITGIDGAAPEPGHAVLTEDLAARVAAVPGDRIELHAFGRSIEVVVDRVVPRRGVAGFWPIDERQQSYNVLVAPGTLAALTAASAAIASGEVQPPTGYLAFSNPGGVEDGAAGTDDAVAAIDARLGDRAERVQPVKRDLIDTADETASSLTELYFTMGMFAVAAGILLLVNIFVMLSDERRSELGMLRALGLRRARLVTAFATEGWIYSIVASVLGGFVGIAVGRVIAWRADQLLDQGDEVYRLDLRFAFDWSTVVAGMAIGFAISLVTILATSVRVSRLNVIAAIRDLPTVRRKRPRRRWLRVGQVATALGVAWTAFAVSTGGVFGVILGPVLALLGLGPILARRFARQRVVTGLAIALLVWGATFLTVLAWMDLDITIPVFLVQGLTMAGAAVTLVSVHQRAIGGPLARMTGRAMPLRIGLAYPIARAFRTAMTMAMFAIVVLTLVYISVISFMFRNHTDAITADSSGGFDVIVTSNPTNPVTAMELARTPGAGAVAPLVYTRADFVVPGDEPKAWPLTGFGPELADAPPALQDLGSYGSEAEAWAAVLRDPGLVIIDEFFLASGGGPPAGGVDIGDELTIIDPVSGADRSVRVAALAEDDFVNSGAWYGITGARELFADRAVPSRFYVSGDAPAALATEIRSRFVANGADAESVRDRIDGILAQNSGFFTLMEQFVGVGLIVGIGGIGVLLVRAVRERRREIGVLRALGFQPTAVSRSFLVEAAFIAVEGVAIGIAVGLVGSYGLVASGNNFAEGMEWGVPWTEVATVAAIAIGTSTLMALWPARRAARIRPAVALRTVD